jgi:hypothetical protein
MYAVIAMRRMAGGYSIWYYNTLEEAKEGKRAMIARLEGD